MRVDLDTRKITHAYADLIWATCEEFQLLEVRYLALGFPLLLTESLSKQTLGLLVESFIRSFLDCSRSFRL